MKEWFMEALWDGLHDHPPSSGGTSLDTQTVPQNLLWMAPQHT
jgi:hypothetical protein